ncbi:MAG: hypothetical protein ACLQUY_25375 [Ktedonobacterales bacterium]
MTYLPRAEAILGVVAAGAGVIGFAIFVFAPIHVLYKCGVINDRCILLYQSLFQASRGTILTAFVGWYVLFFVLLLLIALSAVRHAGNRSVYLVVVLSLATAVLASEISLTVLNSHLLHLTSGLALGVFVVGSAASACLASALAVGREIKQRNVLP